MADADPRLRPSRSTSTADQLRAHILRGLIGPGDHLGQAELAAQFGMSKVPVREALKQLCAEGLLSHDHNRGYFVARLSRDEARQLYTLRRWIEAELLATADWPNAKQLTGLRKLMKAVSQPVTRENREEWLASLAELRHTIFDLSPQKILLREALRLWTLTDRYRSILPAARSAANEQELVEALEAQDRNALLRAYASSRDRIEALLEDALDGAAI